MKEDVPDRAHEPQREVARPAPDVRHPLSGTDRERGDDREKGGRVPPRGRIDTSPA